MDELTITFFQWGLAAELDILNEKKKTIHHHHHHHYYFTTLWLKMPNIAVFLFFPQGYDTFPKKPGQDQMTADDFISLITFRTD